MKTTILHIGPGIWETHSPEETRNLAARLATWLEPNDLILLGGDLGTGKTCFVQGLARGLGIPETEVTSPTFILMQSYSGGRLPLYHVDLYRLGVREALADLGLEEILEAGGVTVVEWADRLQGYFPSPRLEVQLQWVSLAIRRIRFVPQGGRWATVLEALERDLR